MSGVCVTKLPHSCGTSDALQVFLEEDGRYSGYCFACDTFIPNVNGEELNELPKKPIKSIVEIEQEIHDIQSCPSLDLPDRGLREDTLSYFGVKVGVDEADGRTIKFHHYPFYSEGRLSAFKTRLVKEKNMWWVGSAKNLSFFGWEEAKTTGAKRLFITEGEIDAMSLFQILKDSNRGTQWEQYNPAVVSVPFGAGNADKFILKHLNEINRLFQEIVFVPDMDEPGKLAAEAVSKLSPNILIAELPCKDANDCLTQGRSKAAKAAVMFNAIQQKNTRLIRGSTLKVAAQKRPEFGLSWPWEGLTKATRGIRRKETYYFGAGVKMGKSELVNALASYIIVEHQLPIFLAKPEETVAKTYQRLVGKAAGRIFHDPNIEFDTEAFEKFEPLIGDKALILDSYQFINWDTLKEDIRYAVVSEGVRDVFIDPITCLTNQMGSAETNEHLISMTAELSSMAKDLDFTSFIFCHLKAPTSGDPHERGGKVLSHQFAGSRAMMRTCNYMIGIEGNKDPDLSPEERNFRDIVILEDREFGCSERITLYWDNRTGMFNEVKRG